MCRDPSLFGSADEGVPRARHTFCLFLPCGYSCHRHVTTLESFPPASEGDSVPPHPPRTHTSPSRKRLRRTTESPASTAPPIPRSDCTTASLDVHRRLISPSERGVSECPAAAAASAELPKGVSGFSSAPCDTVTAPSSLTTGLSLPLHPSGTALSPLHAVLPHFPRVVSSNALSSPCTPAFSESGRLDTSALSVAPQSARAAISPHTSRSGRTVDLPQHLPHLPLSPARPSLSGQHTPSAPALGVETSQRSTRLSGSLEHPSWALADTRLSPEDSRVRLPFASPAATTPSSQSSHSTGRDVSATVVSSSSSRRRAREHSFLLESASAVASSHRRLIPQRSSGSSGVSAHMSHAEPTAPAAVRLTENEGLPAFPEHPPSVVESHPQAQTATVVGTQDATAVFAESSGVNPVAAAAATATVGRAESATCGLPSPSADGTRRVSFKDRQRLSGVASNVRSPLSHSPRASLQSTTTSSALSPSFGPMPGTAPGSPVHAAPASAGGDSAAPAVARELATDVVSVASTAPTGTASAVSSPSPPGALSASGKKLSFKDRQRFARVTNTDSANSAEAATPIAPRPSLTTSAYRQGQRNSAVAGAAPLVGPPLSLRRKTEQGVLTFSPRPVSSVSATTSATSNTTSAPEAPSVPSLSTHSPSAPSAAAIVPLAAALDIAGAQDVTSEGGADEASIEEDYVPLSRHSTMVDTAATTTATLHHSPFQAAPLKTSSSRAEVEEADTDASLVLAATQNSALGVETPEEPTPHPSRPLAHPIPTHGATDEECSPCPGSASVSPDIPVNRRHTVHPSLLPAQRPTLSWDSAAARPTVSPRMSPSETDRESRTEGRAGEGHTPTSTSTPGTRKNVLSHWAEQEGLTRHKASGDQEAHMPLPSTSNSSSSSAIPMTPLSRSPVGVSGRAHTFTRLLPSESAVTLTTPAGTPTLGSRRDRGKMLSTGTPRLRSDSGLLAFPRSPQSSARGLPTQASREPLSPLTSASPGTETASIACSSDVFHRFNQRIQHLAQSSFDEGHGTTNSQSRPRATATSGDNWSSSHRETPQQISHILDAVMLEDEESAAASRAGSCPPTVSARPDGRPRTNTHRMPEAPRQFGDSPPRIGLVSSGSSVGAAKAAVRANVSAHPGVLANSGTRGSLQFSFDGTPSSTPTPLSPEALHGMEGADSLSPYAPSRLLTLPTRTARRAVSTSPHTTTATAAGDEEEDDARSDGLGSYTTRSHTELLGDMHRSRTDVLAETGRSQTDMLASTVGRLANSASFQSGLVASRANRRTSTFSSLQFSMNRRRPHHQSSQSRPNHRSQRSQPHSRSASSQLFASTTTGTADLRGTRGSDRNTPSKSRRRRQGASSQTSEDRTTDTPTPMRSSSQLLGASLTLADASVFVHDGTALAAAMAACPPPGRPTALPHTITVPSLSDQAPVPSWYGAAATSGSALMTRDDADTVIEVKGDSDDDPLARGGQSLQAMPVDEVLPGEETIGLWSTAEVVFLPQYELLAVGQTTQEVRLKALRSVTASPVEGDSARTRDTQQLSGAASPIVALTTEAPTSLSTALLTDRAPATATMPPAMTAGARLDLGLSLDTETMFSFGRIAPSYYVEPADKEARESTVSRTACPSPVEPSHHLGSPAARRRSSGDSALTAPARAGDKPNSPLVDLAESSLITAGPPRESEEDDCKIGARLIMNADSGVMLLAPRDEVEKYARVRSAEEHEAELEDEEGGACGCDEAFITKDSRGMDYSRYNTHTLFDHCACCQRRPASFLCLHCFVAVCPSHVSRHHRQSPQHCTLFLNLLDIMTSFDRIFWCEKCQQFTWKYTEIYDPLVDQLACTRGTYLSQASRDMRCIGYEVRFTDECEDGPVPQAFDEEAGRARRDVPPQCLPVGTDALAGDALMPEIQLPQSTIPVAPEERDGASSPPSEGVSVDGSCACRSSVSAPSLVAPMQEHLVRPKPAELAADDRVVPLGKAARRLQGLGCSVQGWRATQEDAEAAFMIDIPALHTRKEGDAATTASARRARRKTRPPTAAASPTVSAASSPKRRLHTPHTTRPAGTAGAVAGPPGEASDEESETEEETIPMAVFCVFDGHGGDAVAKIAASQFESHLRAAVQNTRADDIRARALLFYLNTESSHANYSSPTRHRHPSATRTADGLAASSLTGSLTNTADAGSLGGSGGGMGASNKHRSGCRHAHNAGRLLIPGSETCPAATTASSTASPEFHPQAASPSSPIHALPRRMTDERSLLAASPLSGLAASASTHTAAPPISGFLAVPTLEESSRGTTGTPLGITGSVGSPTIVAKVTAENLRLQQSQLKSSASSGQLVEETGSAAVRADGSRVGSGSGTGVAAPRALVVQAAAAGGPPPASEAQAELLAAAPRTSPRGSGTFWSPDTMSVNVAGVGGGGEVSLTGASCAGPTMGQEALEPVPAASAMTISEMEMLRSYFASIMEEALLSLDEAISKSTEGYRGDYNCIGCTACVVGITSNFILCANVGDSGAAFYTPQTIVPISITHRLQSETEMSRIRAAGYNVVNDRIEGMLAVPRALGDFDFKQCGGKGPREQAVSCVPDVTIRPVPSDAQRWGVILACDGVWDTATMHQVHFGLTNTPNDLDVATSAADAVLRAKELVRHHRRGPASFLQDITSPPSSRKTEQSRKRRLTGDHAEGGLSHSQADAHSDGDEENDNETEAVLGGSVVADLGEEVWYGGIDAQLLTGAAGVLAQCVAPADNEAGIGLDNCSLIIVEYRE